MRSSERRLFKRLKHRLHLEAISGLSQEALIIDVAAKILADDITSSMCAAAAEHVQPATGLTSGDLHEKRHRLAFNHDRAVLVIGEEHPNHCAPVGDGQGPKKARSQTRSGYHHGNLRAALIRAAVELIESDGVEGPSV